VLPSSCGIAIMDSKKLCLPTSAVTSKKPSSNLSGGFLGTSRAATVLVRRLIQTFQEAALSSLEGFVIPHRRLPRSLSKMQCTYCRLSHEANSNTSTGWVIPLSTLQNYLRTSSFWLKRLQHYTVLTIHLAILSVWWDDFPQEKLDPRNESLVKTRIFFLQIDSGGQSYSYSVTKLHN
jgi:hypothetical protein